MASTDPEPQARNPRHTDGGGVNESSRSDGFEMIRSEEQLRRTTERVATERIKIERYVVSEQRSITVDVRREEIRVTREPIAPEDAPHISDAAYTPPDPIVVVLHEEKIEVTKTVVPSERVTVRVNSVSGEQEIRETLRREVIDDPEQSAG